MTKKRDTFKLGLTVIVMLALLLAFVLFLGGGEIFASRQAGLLVRLRPGLAMPEISKGSFVSYLGQRVGTVTDTRIIEDTDPDDPAVKDQQFLELRARIRLDLGLRQDCRIKVFGPPLGGMGNLEILSRGTSSSKLDPRIPVYAELGGIDATINRIAREFDENNPESLLSRIKSQLDPQDKASLLAKIHRSTDDVNELTGVIVAELDKAEDDRVLYKFHAALDKLNQTLAELTGMVTDNRKKIDEAVTSLNSALATFDTDVMAIFAAELELKEDRERTLLAKLHDALSKMDTALADVKVVSAGAKRAIVLNESRIDEIFENAAQASAHLKQGIKDLKMHPWKLLFEPSDAERRELHIYEAAREFSDAAAGLDDATSRLKSLIDANGGAVTANDPDLASINEDLTAAVGKFTEAEQALWEALRLK